MKKIRPFAILFFLCISLLTVGCGETGKKLKEEKAAKTTITVAAAASLKGAFDAIGSEFEDQHPGVSLRFNYAASNILARQIEGGAPFDVVALAAEETMNGLDSANLLQPGSRVIFARNRLCIVLPFDSHMKVDKLSDLTAPSFARIAIASPGVPARIYTEEALRNATLWGKLEKRFVYGANVRQVLGYVETGEVDCGFVYKSDVPDSQAKEAFAIDTTLHRPILYPAAIVRNSSAPSIAQDFIAYLRSSPGEEILRKYRFETPEKK